MPTPLSSLTLYPTCGATYTRVCSDGTGVVIGTVCKGEFSSPVSQADANALGCELARLRALRQTLFCNTLSPSDVEDCGSIEPRPQPTPPGALCIQTETEECLLVEGDTDDGQPLLMETP
jgi:hypothetical protein